MLVSSHVHLSNYLSNCLPRSPLTPFRLLRSPSVCPSAYLSNLCVV